MPQLDKQTFFFQYFGLTIFFFLLYFILLNLFVFTIFRVRKVYSQVNRFGSAFANNFNSAIYDDIITNRIGYNLISLKLISSIFFQLRFRANNALCFNKASNNIFENKYK